VDWTRDLHFQTRTTIDTLDYTGTGLNAGSKLVIACAGQIKRELSTSIPSEFQLPDGFSNPFICVPGVLAVSAPQCRMGPHQHDGVADRFCDWMSHAPQPALAGFPLIVLCDDGKFTADTLNNFLWVVFTRSNPAADIYGISHFVDQKHWGCRGPLVIDARLKPHMAPPLVPDSAISRRVDRLFVQGGPLHGLG
jgi:4-hydroxy-3-polyprenylbenzoate decarboxylase